MRCVRRDILAVRCSELWEEGFAGRGGEWLHQQLCGSVGHHSPGGQAAHLTHLQTACHQVCEGAQGVDEPREAGELSYSESERS